MKCAEFIGIDLIIDEKLDVKLQKITEYLKMESFGERPFVEPFEGKYWCAVSNFSLLMLSPIKVKDAKGEYMRYKFYKPTLDLPPHTDLRLYLSDQLSKLIDEEVKVSSYTVTATDVRVDWQIVKELSLEKIKSIASFGFKY
ncbi:MAG: hypothetical protein ACFFDI_06445 [Promethearchaeota archaeon]